MMMMMMMMMRSSSSLLPSWKNTNLENDLSLLQPSNHRPTTLNLTHLGRLQFNPQLHVFCIKLWNWHFQFTFLRSPHLLILLQLAYFRYEVILLWFQPFVTNIWKHFSHRGLAKKMTPSKIIYRLNNTNLRETVTYPKLVITWNKIIHSHLLNFCMHIYKSKNKISMICLLEEKLSCCFFQYDNYKNSYLSFMITLSWNQFNVSLPNCLKLPLSILFLGHIKTQLALRRQCII